MPLNTMVHDASSCPSLSCGSKQIEGHQYSQDDHSVWQKMTCTKCDAEWDNVFVYSNSFVESNADEIDFSGNLFEIITRRTDLVTRDFTHRVLANDEEEALYKFENEDYEPLSENTVERRCGDEEVHSSDLIEIRS